LKAISDSSPIVYVRLRAFVGELRQAFFVFGISRLQAIRLAFRRIFGDALRLGLGLGLRVRFRRMGGAAGEKKSRENYKRTIHRLPHVKRRQV
jgi:hypothetical protein